jgi:hypothetical protein
MPSRDSPVAVRLARKVGYTVLAPTSDEARAWLLRLGVPAPAAEHEVRDAQYNSALRSPRRKPPFRAAIGARTAGVH